MGGGRRLALDVVLQGLAGLVGLARPLLGRAQEEEGLSALAGRGILIQEGDKKSGCVFVLPLPVVDLGRAAERTPPVGVLGGGDLGDSAVDG